MIGKKSVEIWVGAFVLAGIVALVVLAFRVGNLTTADVVNGYRVEAEFDNVGSLKVKSPVTVAGVRIGRVAEIRFDPQTYRALVVMNIDGRYNNLPVDSDASILTSGLLGEQYIGLEPGGAEQYLKTGDRIKVTQSAVVLEKLIGRVLTTFIDKPATNDKK
jgi:phospholipid/cholesterol/gamma-HCH transport system substrate-binding protein